MMVDPPPPRFLFIVVMRLPRVFFIAAGLLVRLTSAGRDVLRVVLVVVTRDVLVVVARLVLLVRLGVVARRGALLLRTVGLLVVVGRTAALLLTLLGRTAVRLLVVVGRVAVLLLTLLGRTALLLVLLLRTAARGLLVVERAIERAAGRLTRLGLTVALLLLFETLALPGRFGAASAKGIVIKLMATSPETITHLFRNFFNILIIYSFLRLIEPDHLRIIISSLS